MYRVSDPARIDKPWGYEIVWAHTDRYVGKILHVNAGHALSLQYHQKKDETLYLLSGEMRFWVGRSADTLEELVFPVGKRFHVTAGTVHKMEAITDIDVLESSTPELDDVVRLEDRYGRA